MKKKSIAAALVVMYTLVVSAVLQGPAAAHYYIDVCQEVGIFDKQDIVPYKEAASFMESTLYVDHRPYQASCTNSTPQVMPTMHSSLHSKGKLDQNKCLEIVGYRSAAEDPNLLQVWGYNCYNPNSSVGGNVVNVPGYNYNQMHFWMSGGGDTSWDLWFYRYDTGTWHFITTVINREVKMVPWAESTGYNASGSRLTWFYNYAASNEFGSWNPIFTCPIQQKYGPDYHQRMISNPVPGRVNFEPWNGSACHQGG